MNAATVWCPSCGAEYITGSTQCSDCRVALVTDRPSGARPADAMRTAVGGADDLVELGEWPRLAAQILRRRLETAGITVMVEWSGTGPAATGTIVIPDAEAEFAAAVVNEIEVDDEVPDTSPIAYATRIEEHLAAAGALLEELRTRLDELEADG